jgi:GTP pyrophosphokinase
VAMSVKTEAITIEDLLNRVKDYDDNSEDLTLIRKAYDYAYKKHFSQKRITGDDYITHPLNVAWILTDVNADGEAIAAALLHDTIEDSDSTFDEIKNLFGENVAKIVDGVTKINRLKFTSDSEQMAANQRKILVGLSSDVRVLIVKLADRLHNMRTLQYKNSFKQKEFFRLFYTSIIIFHLLKKLFLYLTYSIQMH